MATQLSDRQLAVIVDRYAATSAELETRLKTTVAAAYVGIDFYDTTQTLAAANTAGDPEEWPKPQASPNPGPTWC